MREISVSLKYPVTISKITLKIDRNVFFRHAASLNLRRGKDFQVDDLISSITELVPADQLREEVVGELDVHDDLAFIAQLATVMLEDELGIKGGKRKRG